MKKFLKILAIVILVIFVILIAAPVLFKKQIFEKAREIANTSVNAKVDFTDLRLSLIRNFPNLSVSLTGVSIANLAPFEGDTLVSFDELRATVDLISVLKMKNIKVKGILLNNPGIKAIVLNDGTANWDIAKETEAETEEVVDTTAAGSMDMTVALKKFEIRSADLIYDDQNTDMSASLEEFNFVLTGDLSEDFTSIKINSTTDKVNFIMGGMKYVTNAMLNIILDVDADLANSVFTLGENSIGINDLGLKFGGVVKMPDEEAIDIDMTFETTKTDFKSLLSMVPAIYMKDFTGLQAGGVLGISGIIKGTLKGEQTPSADVSLLIENAMFSYPDLPKKAENINIDIKAHYDGIDNDNTTMDVNKFHVELGGNPVDLTLHLITPMSDPQVNARLAAHVDFLTLSDVIPLDSTDITGILDANVSVMGKMSSIETEKYEEFQAEGKIGLAGFRFNSPDVPVPVTINRTSMFFSPSFLELREFDAQLGRSDISLQGKLENFLPYIFKNATIEGSLDFASNLLDIDEFMPSEDTVEEEVTEEDTSQMSVIVIPKNIHFLLNSNLKKVKYDKLDIENIIGMIEVVDGKAILTKLGMNLLDGSMVMSGEYNTQDTATPLVDFHFDMQHIDIPSAFETFNTVQKLAPVAKNARGNVSVQLDFTSFLAGNMQPIMNSVVGRGALQSNNIQLDNSNVLSKIGDIIKSDKFKTVGMKDLEVQFEIRNGRIYVQPFELNIAGNKLTISGDQGIDKTMNYNVGMSVPRSLLGSGAGSAFDGLNSLAGAQGIDIGAGNNIDMSFLVSGMFGDPKVSPMFGGGGKNIKQKVTEQVKEQVQEVKQEVRENLNEQKEKIMKDAETEAQRIREEAKKAGDELVRQAAKEGDQRIKDAGSNPLKKRAAEEYKKQLVKQAESKSTKLQEEADKKAEAVLQKAREKADSL
jgi:hypothetical protein